MPRHNLRLENLHELDGGAVGAIVNAAINSAVSDLDDRGDDGKPRKVVITVNMEKLDNGVTDIHVEAKAMVPVYRSSSTLARPKIDGKKTVLEFQATSPENPEQATLEFEDEDE